MDTEGQRLGKYELQVCLAQGGQGEVWKAFDPRLRRYVAIKQLHSNMRSDPDFISRFEREAQFIAALHHPNIVQIHDFQSVHSADSDNTTAYMVMEYIEGSTLADYIRNTSAKGQFPEATDLVYIFTAISLAIDYAHEKGMIHRDIKPANIMLDQRPSTARSMGKPVLTDFGIAKLQGASTDTTKIIGTPRYTSPEQAQGLSGDKRSDLYSLGIILYEMTTGVTPFRRESPMAMLMQHYQEIPASPDLINPAISPALSEVVLKNLAKNPDARFQSASALTIALAEALNVPVPAELRKTSSPSGVTPLPLPVTTPSPNGRADVAEFATQEMHGSEAVMPPPTVPQQSARRRKRLYIGVAGLLIALVAGSILYGLFWLRTPTNPIVGSVRFLRSANVAPGTFDEVETILQGVQNPSSGDYYAWLLSKDMNISPVSWPLTKNSSLFPSPHIYSLQNLLATMPDFFLITREDSAPTTPNFNPNNRLYYARIPQTTSSVSFDILPCPQGNVCFP